MTNVVRLIFWLAISLTISLSFITISLIDMKRECERKFDVYQCEIIAVPVERKEKVRG